MDVWHCTRMVNGETGDCVLVAVVETEHMARHLANGEGLEYSGPYRSDLGLQVGDRWYEHISAWYRGAARVR